MDFVGESEQPTVPDRPEHDVADLFLRVEAPAKLNRSSARKGRRDDVGFDFVADVRLVPCDTGTGKGETATRVAAAEGVDRDEPAPSRFPDDNIQAITALGNDQRGPVAISGERDDPAARCERDRFEPLRGRRGGRGDGRDCECECEQPPQEDLPSE
jgi:hypothetical protein